jgi:hypothetical protein
MPLTRNPAALCTALLEMSASQAALVEVMELVRQGCEAAREEVVRWGSDGGSARQRWVGCGLIDRVHGAVASAQGVAPWEADETLAGPLQPELSRCFLAIEAYLDLDMEVGWAPADKGRLVADAVVDGEWDGEAGRALVPFGYDEPRVVSAEETFLRLLETAVHK